MSARAEQQGTEAKASGHPDGFPIAQQKISAALLALADVRTMLTLGPNVAAEAAAGNESGMIVAGTD